MRLLMTAVILGLGVFARAADTHTTNLNLTKPAIGSMSWGTQTNANWDIMDSTIAALAASTGTINANGWVTTARLATSAVDTSKLATDSVVGSKILNATIDTAKLNASIQAQLALAGTVAAGYIDTSKLATDSVTGVKILNGTIDTSKLNSTIQSQLSDVAGKQPTGNYVTGGTGDVVFTGPGSVAATIQSGVVDSGKLAASAVTAAKIAAGSVDTAKLNSDIQSQLSSISGKQPAGSYVTSLTGGVTASGPGAAAATVVTNANLTGPVTSVGNATTITAGAVDTAKIATDAVDSTKILAAAVTTAKLASGSVDTSKLATDSVTGAKILSATIDTGKLNATIQSQLSLIAGKLDATAFGVGSVDTTKLAADAVTGVKILNSTIDTAKLNATIQAQLSASGTVPNGYVDTNKLATDSVTGSKILNGTIDTAKLNATIQAQLALAGTGGITQLTGGVTAGPGSGSQAATVVTNANLSGDVSSVGNTTTIGSLKVTTGMLAASAVDSTKLAASAVDTGKLASDSVTGVKILAGTIDTAKLNATIQSQLAASGTVPAGYVDTTKLATDSVTSVKIINGGVDTAKLNASIQAQLSSIAGKQASGNYITGTTGDVVASGPGSVTATIQPGVVDTGKIATDAVTTVKILNLNVTTAKLAALSVDTSKLAADSVTGAKILNGTIDTAKLNATIQAQLAMAGTGGGGVGVSSSCATGYYWDAFHATNGSVDGGACLPASGSSSAAGVKDNLLIYVNGSNKNFTLTSSPLENTLHLYMDGLLQSNPTDYTLAGANIVMGTAPAAGTTQLDALYLASVSMAGSEGAYYAGSKTLGDTLTVVGSTFGVGGSTFVISGGSVAIGGVIEPHARLMVYGDFGSTGEMDLKRNGVGLHPEYPSAWASFYSNENTYSQIILQNLSNGESASSDIVFTGDLGGDTSYYFDIGLNSSKFSNPAWTLDVASMAYITSADDGIMIWSKTNGDANGTNAGFITFGSSTPSPGNIAMKVIGSSVVIGAGGASASVRFDVEGTSEFDGDLAFGSDVNRSTLSITGNIAISTNSGIQLGSGISTATPCGTMFYRSTFTLTGSSTMTYYAAAIQFSTFTLPANTLTTVGDAIEIECTFTTTATVPTTPTAGLYLGATPIAVSATAVASSIAVQRTRIAMEKMTAPAEASVSSWGATQTASAAALISFTNAGVFQQMRFDPTVANTFYCQAQRSGGGAYGFKHMRVSKVCQ